MSPLSIVSVGGNPTEKNYRKKNTFQVLLKERLRARRTKSDMHDTLQDALPVQHQRDGPPEPRRGPGHGPGPPVLDRAEAAARRRPHLRDLFPGKCARGVWVPT